MGERLVALVMLLASAAPAEEEKKTSDRPQAKATFEAALDGAEPAGNFTDRFDPLFADCQRDDDMEARQCAAVRDQMLERLKSTTFVGLGDEAALTWTPWAPDEKQLGLELHGCLVCKKPLQLGGSDEPRFVTSRVPKAIKGGRSVGLDIGFYEVALPDQAAAARFTKLTVPKLVTQFVFKVGPVWKSGDKLGGVTFVPLAQRIFDRCTGKVYASEPPSQKPAEPQPDATCPAKAPVAAHSEEKIPEQLSRDQVVKAMRAVDTKIHSCYLKFKQEGTVSVKMVLDGQSGIEGLSLTAPFDGTPVGECVKKAVSAAPLGKFSGDKMTIIYPFLLR
jgi:hypothetical protein